MLEPQPIVIIGGGHAAAQLCASLVEAAQGGRVHLVCEEAELPYQRPPLSKSFLKTALEPLQLHRAEAWYAEHGITLHRADAAVALDRAARGVRLRSGAVLRYGHLVLATGARARRIPGLPEPLANVAFVRDAADARRLRAQLAAAPRLTVVGGGFIGLEVAASARALGSTVSLVESAPRLLSRSVSPEVAAHVLATHRAAGIELRVGVAVGHFELDGDRVAAFEVDGVREPVDQLVLGIGAVPEEALAKACGLECENGIVVDARMRTSDPRVLAIGDCANFPRDGRRLRLESVQNANDQARTAAATLLGRDQPYRALPWFWSDQGALRLQIAGLVPPDGERVRRPGASEASFSILHYAAGRLACVESVNAPLDHVMSRKLLDAGISPDPLGACDPTLPLKSHLPPA